MGFLSVAKGLLTGGGSVVGSVERLASEFIETNMETAEAKALFVKTLDPNGKMRRDLSRFSCRAYAFYLAAMVGLSFMVAFGIGDIAGAETAAAMMGDLFLPITAAWGSIVGASFGVQATNSIKDKP
tara:strand:+ start:478 stop:858 length:381 start_codon:yes stop_codon:yes gene_type:complete